MPAPNKIEGEFKICLKAGHSYPKTARTCTICYAERTAKWAKDKRHNNPEWAKEQRKKYRDPEKDREYLRRHRANLPNCQKKCCKKCLKYQAAYYAAHQIEIQDRALAWYETNKERALQQRSDYKKRRPEIVKASYHKRRALMRSAGGVFTAEQWLKIVKTQQSICNHCNEQCDLTVDHIVPIARGGSNNVSNIQGLCLRCNCSKGSKLESEVA